MKFYPSVKDHSKSIYFENAGHHHLTTIYEWLTEPHMQEFWDNSQEHRDDILLFVNGRIEPSNYFEGIFTYWVGSIENHPFSFLLTAEYTLSDDSPQLWKDHISTSGATYTIDFGIGNRAFLNKGLAAPTLIAFMEFFKAQVDTKADTFFIDPDKDNPRAKHVYEKAGFKLVGEFNGEKKYWDFSGENTYLMVKKIPH